MGNRILRKLPTVKAPAPTIEMEANAAIINGTRTEAAIIFEASPVSPVPGLVEMNGVPFLPQKSRKILKHHIK